jgi:hypothetical protein
MEDILEDVIRRRQKGMSEQKIYGEVMAIYSPGIRDKERSAAVKDDCCVALQFETRVAHWQRAVLAALAVTAESYTEMARLPRVHGR